jgi:hypothetical protein
MCGKWQECDAKEGWKPGQLLPPLRRCTVSSASTSSTRGGLIASVLL